MKNIVFSPIDEFEIHPIYFIDFLKSKNIDPQPLRDLFKDFVKDAVTIPRPEGVYILPLEQQNVLIELKTKNFYVIDPW